MLSLNCSEISTYEKIYFELKNVPAWNVIENNSKNKKQSFL